MALNDKLPLLYEHLKNNADKIEHNQILFDVYEGTLLKYILYDLRETLSEKSYNLAKTRVAPINLLVQIVDKLSKIYSKPPKRSIVEGTGTDSDKELLSWYENEMDLNETLNVTNELFNLHKSVTFEPYIEDAKPRLRNVPADRSIWFSSDPLNPTNPTEYIKFLGEQKINGEDTQVYFIYSNDEFLIVDKKMRVIPSLMAQMELDGTNPIGQIPAIYVNKSKFSVVPPMDTDFLKMTKLIPILLSDLNFAAMMQSFSIIYGINVDNENAVISPNAFWTFHSKPGSDDKPEVGIIKPQVDIDQVLNLATALVSMWLKSRNIRPGVVADLSISNAASGISKIIDESDTSEDRQRQVGYFKKAENKFWKLITKQMHPYWMDRKMIDTNLSWSPTVEIQVDFQEQTPLLDRTKVLDEVIKELNASLTLPQIAIQRLNPEMSENEAMDLLNKIDELKAKPIVVETNDVENTVDDETKENLDDDDKDGEDLEEIELN